jgi:hypothetical protein
VGGKHLREIVELSLLPCKRQRKLNCRGLLWVSYYLDALELRQFGLEGRRYIEYDNFVLRLQIEFLKYGCHGRSTFGRLSAGWVHDLLLQMREHQRPRLQVAIARRLVGEARVPEA